MSEDTVGEVSTFLWWLGWRPFAGVLLGVILAGLFVVAKPTLVSLAVGALIGLGLWYTGTKEVDRTYWTLLDDHAEYTKQVVEGLRNDRPHGTCYTLNYSSGTSLWVKPDERYFTTHALVGDESVTFHEGVGVDMKRRIPYVRNDFTEIRYEWLSSIQYERPYVRLELTSGKSIRYRANDAPDALFDDVRAHMQRRPQDTAEEKGETIQREFN
ncbi:hypothetical protein NKF26_11025 [Haladaptatus sp. AB618]|uniref:hypothetical protein n=1 Tax=Haladaptatus sp. AB618 TaxID=2934173 RepID=UPI00209BEFE8|nr:hypothetical protein [Haladaptatus sp. AB618]MCO8254335.1 hypothetical protein [Haladaptatus sp. AB618]